LKDIQFEIISEIYRLLSMYDEDDFLEASRMGNIPLNFKMILELLAKEHRKSMSDSISEIHSHADINTHSEYNNKLFKENLDAANQQFAQYLEIRFSNEKDFPSKETLLRFARNFGINIEYSSKDSRYRILPRLINEIIKAPKSKKMKILDILSEGQDNQTQGWFNIIRNSL
jgi:hypothetical protein